MSKPTKGISLFPQQIRSSKGAAWYYENGGSIDVMIDTTQFVRPTVVQVRIPSSMLRKTLERQQFMKIKKGGKSEN